MDGTKISKMDGGHDDYKIPDSSASGLNATGHSNWSRKRCNTTKLLTNPIRPRVQFDPRDNVMMSCHERVKWVELFFKLAWMTQAYNDRNMAFSSYRSVREHFARDLCA